VKVVYKIVKAGHVLI